MLVWDEVSVWDELKVWENKKECDKSNLNKIKKE